MEIRVSESTFDGLMYQLAVVNAKLQDEDQEDIEVNLRERRKIMEQIVQARRKADLLIGF